MNFQFWEIVGNEQKIVEIKTELNLKNLKKNEISV